MRRIIAGFLAVGFVLAMVTPAAAQLIDWSRKTGGTAPTAPTTRTTPRTQAQQAPQLIEIRGTIIDLDKRANQVTIRDASDGLRKAFIVDAETMKQLSPYDEVLITIEQGSRIAKSVQVITY